MNASRIALLFAAFLVLFPAPVSRADTYQDWASGCFTPAEIAAGLASPTSDADGDACPNLFEYFGDTLPKDQSSSLILNLAYDIILDEVTVSFPAGTGREDIDCVVMVSDDLLTWSQEAVLVGQVPTAVYHLSGHRYVKIGVKPKSGILIDSDGDGLSDYFEESLVDAHPDDAFSHIGQILPGDDFDNDGTLNLDEEDNRPMPLTFTRPAMFAPASIADALDSAAPVPSPAALLVHTPLQ